MSPGHRQCELSPGSAAGRKAEGKPAETGSAKLGMDTAKPQRTRADSNCSRAVPELEPCPRGTVAQGRPGEQLAYLAFPVLAE